MTTVKKSKKSNSPSSQKKTSSPNPITIKAYSSTAILAALIGTYLELLLVGAEVYSFPTYLIGAIFPIPIFFTLLIVPCFTCVFIYIMNKLQPLRGALFILIISLMMPFIEIIMEDMEVFSHTNAWKHEYSILGYFVYLFMMWRFYRWMINGNTHASK